MSDPGGDTVGKRVRLLRERLGYERDQQGFAEAMGVALYKQVSQWENDAKEPPAFMLAAMAGLTRDRNAVYAWLLNGGEPPPILPLAFAGPRSPDQYIEEAITLLRAVQVQVTPPDVRDVLEAVELVSPAQPDNPEDGTGDQSN